MYATLCKVHVPTMGVSKAQVSQSNYQYMYSYYLVAIVALCASHKAKGYPQRSHNYMSISTHQYPHI